MIYIYKIVKHTREDTFIINEEDLNGATLR